MSSSRLIALATRIRRRAVPVGVFVGAAVVAALVVPAGGARVQALPVNTAAPTITYPPGIGNYLTPTPGTWTLSVVVHVSVAALPAGRRGSGRIGLHHLRDARRDRAPAAA